MKGEAWTMNIGAVAERSGVPPKTIRYYESIGLVTPANREANGYRTYSAVDMRTLNFIRRARGLGFSVEEVRALLDLWRNRRRTSAAVRSLASEHLKALDRKIEELQSMRRTLARLIEECRGDVRSDCPILEDLGEGSNGCLSEQETLRSPDEPTRGRRGTAARTARSV